MKIDWKSEKTAIFIDGLSLHRTAKALGFEVDYRKLHRYFSGVTCLIRAYFYTALDEEQEFSAARPLVDWLSYNGYSPVTKPIKRFNDENGHRKFKGNIGVELATDAMLLAPSLDRVLFFVSDGDYRVLAAALQESGIRVGVISTIRTQPAMVADDLRRQADDFLDLADLEAEIGREIKGRTAAKDDID